MSEHTKGTWEATSDESEPLIIAGSTTIAMCFDITGDEQEANARLMAASLDLLEACKNSPAPNVFAGFANFAEDCSTKPSMAVYHQQFIALSTFLRSCVDRSENTLAALHKAEPS